MKLSVKRRMRVAALLTLFTLVILMVTPAFANTTISYGGGSGTVRNAAGNTTTYKAYQIFKAKVNTDGSLSSFAWQSSSIRTAVVNVINSFDSTYSLSEGNAQKAAKFLSDAYLKVAGDWDSGMTTDQQTILKYKELLNDVAQAVSALTPGLTVSSGVKTTLKEGYWMFVSDESSIGTDEEGTSAIFMVASDGGSVDVTEKTTVPTIVMDILNDSYGHTYSTALETEWKKGADGERGQALAQRVIGTIPSNVATFGTFYYSFNVTLPTGVDNANASSWHVYIDGKEVTSYFTKTLTKDSAGKSSLVVSCSNLKGCGVTLTKTSQIILTYDVSLNSKCVIGAAGNVITATITYSGNPYSSALRNTHEVKNYVYAFELGLDKKDASTNVSLAGAEFIIRAVGADGTISGAASDDVSSRGKYVLKNGTYGTEREARANPFVTDANGEFSVNGLDAGTYAVIETKAPEGYKWLNQTTYFTIAAAYGTDGVITSLSNTVFGNADACAGVDTISNDSNDGNCENYVQGDAGTGAIASKALVNVTVGNYEKIVLPLSGNEGVGKILAAGGVVIMISGVAFVLMKRREKKNEG